MRHGSVKVRSGSRKTSGKRPNSCEFGYRERRCFGLLPAIRDFDGAVPGEAPCGHPELLGVKMMIRRLANYPLAAATVSILLRASLSLAVDVKHTFVETDRYAAADLRHSFPAVQSGDVVLAGVRFRVTGKRVRVPPGKKCALALPSTKCAGIHILHYLENSGGEIGSYVITFVDDERVDVSITCGLGIHDWWKPQPLPYASIAHRDTFRWREKGQPVAFWRFSVRNPRPDASVKSLEVVNTHTLATINVIAITLSRDLGSTVGGTPVFDPTASEEQRLVDVLRFKTKELGKGEACEQLKMTGTRESVAALAALLADEKWSHAARFALEPMPYPEAGAALREALGTTSGKTRVGIIESLGERREAESVPALAPLVSDGDPVAAAAAATALGKIGGPEAVRILRTAKVDYRTRSRSRETSGRSAATDPGPNSGEFGYLGSASAIVQQAISHALLACAEQLLDPNRAEAREVYRELFGTKEPQHVRAAAYRGLILAAGHEGVGLVTSALTGSDHASKMAALPFVREMKGVEATRAFASLLGRVPPETQLALIAALGQRGDTAAASAIARATQSERAAVRCAAYRALALCGDASVVPALAKAAAEAEGSERKAAMGALTRLQGPGASEAIQSHLRKASASERSVLASALGARRSARSVPALLKLARDEAKPVRLAAIGSLGEVADAATVGKLAELVREAKGPDERSAAERAMVATGLRVGAPPPFVQSVLAGLGDTDPAVRCAMLRVCGRFRNAQLLEALSSSVGDKNADVCDAAVRAIAGSPDPQALPHLLTIASEAEKPTHRVLALRGFARLIGEAGDLKDTERDGMLRQAMGLAKRPEDKKLILGMFGRSETREALELVQRFLDDPDVSAEAAAACVAIAKPLRDTHPDVVQAACRSVLEQVGRRRIPSDLRKAAEDLLRVTSATPAAADDIRFEKTVVDRQFRSEGVAVADVNRDGRNDILAGDVWYAAPDWKLREVRPAGKYSPDRGYSKCFANFAWDVDGDGWTDSIVIGFPGAPAHWYENPRGREGHWKERRFVHSACNETPLFADLLGEGKRVPVFGVDGRLNWLSAPESLDQQWSAWPISETTPAAKKFGHGLGVGDVNGDGRADVIATEGWWEAPGDRAQPDWKFHKVSLGPACANMLVYDVDGDGDNDVVTSSAHRYGIWWFEQRREGFRQHEIHKGVSQTHALVLADMNSDGLRDLVTGKRYHAHNGKDPGSAEPAVVCWLELRRPPGGKPEFVMHEIDSDSGVGTQFEVCDFDGDGLLDVVTSNKKGVYAFVQRRSK